VVELVRGADRGILLVLGVGRLACDGARDGLSVCWCAWRFEGGSRVQERVLAWGMLACARARDKRKAGICLFSRLEKDRYGVLVRVVAWRRQVLVCAATGLHRLRGSSKDIAHSEQVSILASTMVVRACSSGGRKNRYIQI